MILIVGLITLRVPPPRPGHIVPIEQICKVDKRLGYDISTAPAQADELWSLYTISPDNQPLFAHLDQLDEMYREGVTHKGLTYIYGAPGVGKSFIVRKHLMSMLADEAVCLVNLGDVFADSTLQPDIQITQKSDLVTTTEQVMGRLPAISNPSARQLEHLLSTSGCIRNGELVPLVIVDDIDEIHPDSSRLILRSLDNLILERGQPIGNFLHVAVVGASEGFAAWYRDPKAT